MKGYRTIIGLVRNSSYLKQLVSKHIIRSWKFALLQK